MEANEDVEEDVASNHLLHGRTDGCKQGEKLEALHERRGLFLLQCIDNTCGWYDIVKQGEDFEDGGGVFGQLIVLWVRYTRYNHNEDRAAVQEGEQTSNCLFAQGAVKPGGANDTEENVGDPLVEEVLAKTDGLCVRRRSEGNEVAGENADDDHNILAVVHAILGTLQLHELAVGEHIREKHQ